MSTSSSTTNSKRQKRTSSQETFINNNDNTKEKNENQLLDDLINEIKEIHNLDKEYKACLAYYEAEADIRVNEEALKYFQTRVDEIKQTLPNLPLAMQNILTQDRYFKLDSNLDKYVKLHANVTEGTGSVKSLCEVMTRINEFLPEKRAAFQKMKQPIFTKEAYETKKNKLISIHNTKMITYYGNTDPEQQLLQHHYQNQPLLTPNGKLDKSDLDTLGNFTPGAMKNLFLNEELELSQEEAEKNKNEIIAQVQEIFTKPVDEQTKNVSV
jgi:hypothetical protein